MIETISYLDRPTKSANRLLMTLTSVPFQKIITVQIQGF